MYKRIILGVMLVLLCVGVALAEDKCPVQVQLKFVRTQGRMGVTYAYVQAVVDNVRILKVAANRGNVTVHSSETVPCDLKFGERTSVIVSSALEAIVEIQVDTDKGAWTFSFNR